MGSGTENRRNMLVNDLWILLPTHCLCDSLPSPVKGAMKLMINPTFCFTHFDSELSYWKETDDMQVFG